MGAPGRDVGLGTAYERWAIYRRLEIWFAERPPETAAEGPVDGMAGMPGLHLLPLARAGTRVTVVSPDEAALDQVRAIYRRAGLSDRLDARLGRELAPGDRFDLVLGFNFGPEVPDWRAHLAGLARAARRTLVVFATHPRSYGVWIRRAARRLEPGGGRPELFDHPSCQPELVRAELRRAGRIVDERFVDCPWWPDLFVSAGETLLGASLARLRGARVAGPSATPYDWGPEAFPFARETEPAEMRGALRRHPGFDRAPSRVAGWFGHHRAFLVEIRSGGGR